MRFRKKPVVIEAEQFTEDNKDRCLNFVRCNCTPDRDENGLPTLRIQTLEGDMTASLGDWIIRGAWGEFYPCKPDIFDATYKPAERDDTEHTGTRLDLREDIRQCVLDAIYAETGHPYPAWGGIAEQKAWRHEATLAYMTEASLCRTVDYATCRIFAALEERGVR